MDIQELYDSLTPYERQQFANKNVDVITDTLTDDDSVDLSGYSKEELLKKLKERELVDVLNGAIYAGVTDAEINNWIEKQLMD